MSEISNLSELCIDPLESAIKSTVQADGLMTELAEAAVTDDAADE